MQIVTSWEQRGIELGRLEERELVRMRQLGSVSRQLMRRLGVLSMELKRAVEGLDLDGVLDLGEALFDFEGVEDLNVWLREKGVGE
jgi:hypothetical protein